MQELENIQQPRLQELAVGVPQTLRLSRAESTVQKYTRSFDRWKKWAAQYPEISVPSSTCPCGTLPATLTRNFRGHKTAMDDAVNALAWEHELGGLPSPTSHPTVRTMQESAHRIKKKRPKVKKEPATPQLLQKMANTLAQSQHHVRHTK